MEHCYHTYHQCHHQVLDHRWLALMQLYTGQCCCQIGWTINYVVKMQGTPMKPKISVQLVRFAMENVWVLGFRLQL